MLKRFCILLVFMIALSHFGFSQEILDSIIIIANKPADITASRAKINADPIKSVALSDALQSISSGIIQGQTPGGLQTFLHKGLPARHFPIIWNGMNMLSALNGVSDMTLIPVMLMGDARMYDFGSTTSLGSQSVSGGIIIESQPSSTAKISFFSELSTLQNYRSGASFQTKYKTSSHRLGLSGTFDRNLFKFQDFTTSTFRSPTDLKMANLLYDGRWQIKSNQVISANVWINQAHRNIINSITSAPNDQTQRDANVRAHLSHKFFNKNHILSTAVSYQNEALDYLAPGIDSRALVHSVQGNVSIIDKVNESYRLFASTRSDRAQYNFIDQILDRKSFQIGGTKRWSLKQWKAQVAIAQDWLDAKRQPITGNTQLQYNDVVIRVSRTYQPPALNDLYWPDGGNPELKSERSLQGEINYKWSSHIDGRASIFSNWVNDWIQWTPNQSGKWSPSNLQKVQSSGITLFLEKKIVNSRHSIHLSAESSYTSALIKEHDINPSLKGQQLIYIPQWKTVSNLTWTKGIHHAACQLISTSKRFETTENTTFIPAYQTFNLYYKLTLKNSAWQLNINNVTNTQYEIVSYFPMPGINASVLFTYDVPL